MQVLHIFDAQNYDPAWPCYEREAVRAVIVRGGQIALVKSAKEGYYKFPGGGIEPGESHLEALIRETKEETGLQVLPDSVKALGMVWEKRRGLYDQEQFSQKSYYYLAAAGETICAQKLDDYEEALGFTPEWPRLESAYRANAALGENPAFTFLVREAFVLKLLLDEEARL